MALVAKTFPSEPTLMTIMLARTTHRSEDRLLSSSTDGTENLALDKLWMLTNDGNGLPRKLEAPEEPEIFGPASGGPKPDAVLNTEEDDKECFLKAFYSIWL